LTLWAWNEMVFLMGFITGPRRVPASPGLSGWPRFRQSAATVISHEIAIAVTGLLIWSIVAGGVNLFGLWTFAVLWLMRLSTKINIFLGAPNITDEFLPPHLQYLSSYFRRRPMNGFFPFSVTVATLATGLIVYLAFGAELPSGEVLGYSLLAALMALAVLEHWLLFVPVPAARLWSWSLRSHGGAVVAVPARGETQMQSQPHIRSNG
jgi:putative photosynthetic complex assembly protein 2